MLNRLVQGLVVGAAVGAAVSVAQTVRREEDPAGLVARQAGRGALQGGGVGLAVGALAAWRHARRAARTA